MEVLSDSLWKEYKDLLEDALDLVICYQQLHQKNSEKSNFVAQGLKRKYEELEKKRLNEKTATEEAIDIDVILEKCFGEKT